MANVLEFQEGFDVRGGYSDLGYSGTLNQTNGRFGGYATWGSGDNSLNHCQIPFGVSLSEYVLFFAWRVRNTNDQNIATLWDSTNAALLNIHYNSSNKIVIRRSTTELFASTEAFSAGTWVGIGVYVLHSDTVGKLLLWINGVAQGSELTGLDTINAGNGSISKIDFYVNQSAAVDDLHLFSLDSPGAYDSPMGEYRIITQAGNGNGSTQQFTPNTGTVVTAVDEIPNPDDDTTYAYDNTNGHRMLLGFPALGITAGKIMGAKFYSRFRKDDAATYQLATVVKSATSEDVETAIAVGSSYLTHAKDQFVDPDTSAVWGQSALEASEAGVELTVV